MSALPLLGPLLCVLSGLGVLGIVGGLTDRSLPVRAAYAYLLGLATSGSLLFAASHIGVPLGRELAFFAFVTPSLAGLALVLLRKKGPAARASSRRPGSRRHRVLPVTVGAVLSAGLLLDALGRPVTDWDGRAIWCAHARYIRAARSVDAATLKEPAWYVPNPKYPVLLPVLQVAVEEMIGAGDDDRAIRPLYALFFPAFLLVLFDAARRRAGLLAAVAVTSIAAVLPHISGSAAICYSDLPLGCLLGAGFLLLTEPNVSAGQALVAGLLFSGTLLIKNEGVVLVSIALTCAIAFAHAGRKDGRSSTAGALAPFAPAILLIGLSAILRADWRAGIASRVDTDYWARLSATSLLEGIRTRIPVILRAVTAQTLDRDAWGLLPWTIPVLLVFGARALRRRPLRPLLAFLAAAFCVPLTAYLVGEFDPAWVIETTWKRFLVQIALPFFVVFAAVLRPLLRGRLTRRAFAIAGPAAALAVLAFTGYQFVALPPATDLEADLDECPDAERPLAREDPSFPASIDRPAEAGFVKGDLVVAGWSQDVTGSCEVLRIEIDGATRDCLSFARTARLDVATVLPRLGNCDRAGYEARFAFEPPDAGPHEIRVWFRSPDGKVRSLARRFRWMPS